MAQATTIVRKRCVCCGKVHDIELDAEKVALWQAGAHIQDVWPEMPADQRETLISGTCPSCFADLFPPED